MYKVHSNRKLASTSFLMCLLFISGYSVSAENGSASSKDTDDKIYLDYEYEKSLDYFKNKLKNPDEKNDALIYLSRLAFDNGHADAALDYMEHALALAPNSAEELVLSGDIYCNRAQHASIFSALKLAKKCIGQYEAALAVEPENIRALAAATDFKLNAPAIAGGSDARGHELLKRLSSLSPEDANIIELEQLLRKDKREQAFSMADQLTRQGFKSARNEYSVAHIYRDGKEYAKAQPLFEHLITLPVTLDNKWFVVDSYLQLGEILLEKNEDITRSVLLLSAYKAKNHNPEDLHYFWSTWSLAKACKAAGDQQRYEKLIGEIRAEDYKKDKDFAKAFDAAID